MQYEKDLFFIKSFANNINLKITNTVQSVQGAQKTVKNTFFSCVSKFFSVIPIMNLMLGNCFT